MAGDRWRRSVGACKGTERFYFMHHDDAVKSCCGRMSLQKVVFKKAVMLGKASEDVLVKIGAKDYQKTSSLLKIKQTNSRARLERDVSVQVDMV